MLDVLDLDRQVRCAERQPDPLDAAPLVREPRDVCRPQAILADQPVDDEEARVAGLRETEEADEPRVEDVDDAEVAVAEQRPDVGAEVDRDAVREATASLGPDPQALPDPAARPVGGDDPPGAEPALLAPLPVEDEGLALAVTRLQGSELPAVVQGSAQLGGAPPQDRLEPDLRDEQPA